MHVEVCAQKVSLCKSLYAEAMAKLEQISESLHNTRHRQSLPNLMSITKFIGEESADNSPPLVRGQGVGAESSDCIEEVAFTPTAMFCSSRSPHCVCKMHCNFADTSSVRCKAHDVTPSMYRHNSEPSPLPLVDGLLHVSKFVGTNFSFAVRHHYHHSYRQNNSGEHWCLPAVQLCETEKYCLSFKVKNRKGRT